MAKKKLTNAQLSELCSKLLFNSNVRLPDRGDDLVLTDRDAFEMLKAAPHKITCEAIVAAYDHRPIEDIDWLLNSGGANCRLLYAKALICVEQEGFLKHRTSKLRGWPEI